MMMQVDSSLLMASLEEYQDAQQQDWYLPDSQPVSPVRLPYHVLYGVENNEVVPETPQKRKKRSRVDDDATSDSGASSVRRYLDFGGVSDSYYYQEPPMGILLTQAPPPSPFEVDIDEYSSPPPVRNDLQDAYDELVSHAKCSKRAVLQGVHGLSGSVLTLLKGEQRLDLNHLKNMERLMRNCLQLRLKLKIRNSKPRVRTQHKRKAEEDEDNQEGGEVMPPPPIQLLKKIKKEEDDERDLFSDSESVQEISTTEDD